MKLSSLLFLLIILSEACSNADEGVKEDITVSDNDTLNIETGNEMNEQTIAVLDKSSVFRFTKSNVPDFNWNSFQLTRFWKEDTMLIRPFSPPPGYFENYGPLLKYSPDSSKFIDLDSYNISIRKNAKGERVGQPQGPDTEVSLIDVSKKETTRLVFLGPGNTIEDAAWLDNENLVLVSSVDNSDARPNASVIKFNLPSRTYYVYETADTAVVNNLKGYWKRERLKDVILK